MVLNNTNDCSNISDSIDTTKNALIELFNNFIFLIENKIDKHDNTLDILKKLFNEYKKKLDEHHKISITHCKKLDEHDEILDTRTKQLDEHDDILHTNSKKLDERDEILNTHSIKLDEHDEILNTHSKKFYGHDEILDTHSKKLDELNRKYLKDILSIFLGMEKRAFIDLWSHFEKQNKNLLIRAKEIFDLQDTTFYRKEVIIDLPESILNIPEVEILYNKINSLLKPLKNYYSQINRLNYLNKRALEFCKEIKNFNSEEIDFSKSIPKQLNNIRYASQLIRNFQLSSDIDIILEFKPEQWVREHFIEFADLFLNQYKNAQNEKYYEKMKKPYDIIMKLLEKADISDSVIKVTPQR